jgi:hypothetical protein
VPTFVASGDTEVGFAGLAGAIDHATHHRNLQRQFFVGKSSLGTIGHINHIDFGATTTRAGNEVDIFSLAQTEGLEQLAPGAGFFDRVGGEAETDGVTDAFQQQCCDTSGGFHQATRQRPRFGHPEMQRMVGDGAQLAISIHHERHVGGLHRNFDEIKTDFFEITHFGLGRLDHGVGGEATVFFVQCWVERTAIDPDANRHLAIAGLAGNSLDVFGLANVARVQAQPLHAGFERSQCHFVLMVNVSDDRHRRPRNNLGQTFGRVNVVACAPHDVATSRSQCIDLRQGAFDIGSFGDGHRLHADWRIATDGNLADANLTGGLAWKQRSGGH